jgi:ABC-type Fe3+ transport system permease subunit
LLVFILAWPLLAIPVRFLWLSTEGRADFLFGDWLARLLPALGVTFTQAAACATLSTALSLLCLPVLFAQTGRLGLLLRLVVVIPGLVPPFLLVLGWFRLFPDWRGPGALGQSAVALALAFSTMGYQSLQLADRLTERLAQQAAISRVLGIGRLRFLWRIARPQLTADLAHGAALSFAIAASSLTIPLLLADSREPSLEVLALQTFAFEGRWLESMGYAQVQTLLVLALSALLLPAKATERAPSISDAEATASLAYYINGSILGWRAGVLALAAPWAVVLAGLWFRPDTALRQLAGWSHWRQDLLAATLSSAFLALLFLLFATALGALAVYSGVRGWSRHWLGWSAAPSAVVIGLACLMVAPRQGHSVLATMAIGLTLSFFPFAYRWSLASWLDETRSWRQTAQVLGLTPSRLFSVVMWPEFWRRWAPVMGLCLIWVWADYSVTAIIADRDRTLSLLAHSQLQSYRLDLASALIFLSLLCGLLSYLCLFRSRDVFDP